MWDKITILGILMVVIGVMLVFIGTFMSILYREHSGKIEGGGLIMIGPIPIVIASSPLIALLLMIMALILMVFYVVVLRGLHLR